MLSFLWDVFGKGLVDFDSSLDASVIRRPLDMLQAGYRLLLNKLVQLMCNGTRGGDGAKTLQFQVQGTTLDLPFLVVSLTYSRTPRCAQKQARGLTKLNAKQPMRRRRCCRRFTSLFGNCPCHTIT